MFPLPSLPTCTRLHTPAPTCTCLHTPVPSCTHLHLPALTCTLLHVPAPTCTHLHTPAPSCNLPYPPASACIPGLFPLLIHSELSHSDLRPTHPLGLDPTPSGHLTDGRKPASTHSLLDGQSSLSRSPRPNKSPRLATKPEGSSCCPSHKQNASLSAASLDLVRLSPKLPSVTFVPKTISVKDTIMSVLLSPVVDS